jgi:hypothetical protein
MYYGAAAFFSDLNARGGINGRKVIFNTCDDGGDNKGNTTCARTTRRSSPSSPTTAWPATASSTSARRA